jgi:protein phosphatase
MQKSVQDRTGCHTECGRRPVNQDAVLAVRLSDGRELVAVADGMGGHSAGEVASRTAVETLWTRLRAGSGLVDAVVEANRAVRAAALGDPAWSGMGTTLVALLRSGTSYEIVNVGDSRAYRIAGGTATQLTHDHSVVAEAMRQASGEQTDIARSRWRHALTRAIGTDDEVQVDHFGPFDASEPHVVLLCTDGLYRSVADDVLVRHAGATRDPWAVARALSAEAYANGSSDNISAAVVLMGAAIGQRVRPSVRGPVVVPERRRRKQPTSRRTRCVELQLAATIISLIVVVMFLMRLL